jgi:hypothetical protein
VLLPDQAAKDEWMTALWEIARELQKPPPRGALNVVRIDAREDTPAS